MRPRLRWRLPTSLCNSVQQTASYQVHDRHPRRSAFFLPCWCHTVVSRCLSTWLMHAKPSRRMLMCAGPQLDLPQDVTVQQLETLLNGLLSNEEKLPYSFFVDDVELAQELGQHLLKHKVCWRRLPVLLMTLWPVCARSGFFSGACIYPRLVHIRFCAVTGH